MNSLRVRENVMLTVNLSLIVYTGVIMHGLSDDLICTGLSMHAVIELEMRVLLQ